MNASQATDHTRHVYITCVWPDCEGRCLSLRLRFNIYKCDRNWTFLIKRLDDFRSCLWILLMGSQDMSSVISGNKHWIFLVWGQDSFQLCLWEWTSDIFDGKSGRFQTCLRWQKTDYLDEKSGQFLALFMSTKTRYFWQEVRTFSVMFVAMKISYFWWEVETISSCVNGDKDFIYFDRKSGHFQSHLWQLETDIFDGRSGQFPAMFVWVKIWYFWWEISSCVNGDKDFIFLTESWDVSSCCYGKGTQIFHISCIFSHNIMFP